MIDLILFLLGFIFGFYIAWLYRQKIHLSLEKKLDYLISKYDSLLNYISQKN